MSHSLDEGEAGARETEEAVVTISLTSVLAISFYVVVHSLSVPILIAWMMVSRFLLKSNNHDGKHVSLDCSGSHQQ